MEEIWWYKGAERFKRLQLTPWSYKIPPLYFLKGLPKPEEIKIIKFERPKVKEEIKSKKLTNQLF